ncbi:MAG: L-serine ammonia-lyase, iron-sulfur-dependent, subunit alpha, partial [Oscillospiraceae bacterium]
MYKNAEELMQLCKAQNKRIWQEALDTETKLTGLSEEKVMAHFESRLDIMISSATKALEQKMTTKGGLIDGVSSCQYSYSKNETLSGN